VRWLLIAALAVGIAWLLAVLALLWLGRRTLARELIMFLPNLISLFRGLLGDERVPRTSKALLLLGALWLASPIDLLPEFLPGIGALDDAVVAGLVLRHLVKRAGPEVVRRIVGRGERVFLDLKFHDIPNTVAGAVASASQLGVSLLTVHGLGGKAMLEAAVGALPALGMRLLAVTVLTSHDEASLGEIGVGRPLADQVRDLARLARSAGVDGVVASPHEVALIREACGADFVIVTPGIRPAGARAGDQARAATPAAALSAGADYLVVGRPVTEADDPAAAAQAIVKEMEAGRA